MVRAYDVDNQIIYKDLFPYRRLKKIDTSCVVVGVGGNVGDSYWIFKKALKMLQNNNCIKVITTSPLLKNPPFGFVEQNDFLNALIVVDTSMRALEFLRYILRVEKRLGRKRSFKNAPRTIDMDIIFFKGQRICSPHLKVPHPQWSKRLSVILPLTLL